MKECVLTVDEGGDLRLWRLPPSILSTDFFFRRGVALLPHLEPVIRKKILSLVFGGFGCLSLVVGFVEEARL